MGSIPVRVTKKREDTRRVSSLFLYPYGAKKPCERISSSLARRRRSACEIFFVNSAHPRRVRGSATFCVFACKLTTPSSSKTRCEAAGEACSRTGHQQTKNLPKGRFFRSLEILCRMSPRKSERICCFARAQCMGRYFMRAKRGSDSRTGHQQTKTCQ